MGWIVFAGLSVAVYTGSPLIYDIRPLRKAEFQGHRAARRGCVKWAAKTFVDGRRSYTDTFSGGCFIEYLDGDHTTVARGFSISVTGSDFTPVVRYELR